MSDLSVSGVGPSDNGGKKSQDVQKEENYIVSIFNELDTDGSGDLSEEEMKDHQELFQIMQKSVGKNILGKNKKITLKRLKKLGDIPKDHIVAQYNNDKTMKALDEANEKYKMDPEHEIKSEIEKTEKELQKEIEKLDKKMQQDERKNIKTFGLG